MRAKKYEIGCSREKMKSMNVAVLKTERLLLRTIVYHKEKIAQLKDALNSVRKLRHLK